MEKEDDEREPGREGDGGHFDARILMRGSYRNPVNIGVEAGQPVARRVE